MAHQKNSGILWNWHIYKGVNKIQKSSLQWTQKKYMFCEMFDIEIVEQYFSKLTDLVNKMWVYDEKIEDKVVDHKVLLTMLVKYDYVANSSKESWDMNKITIVEFQGSIEGHMNKINERMKKPVDKVVIELSRVELNFTELMRLGSMS